MPSSVVIWIRGGHGGIQAKPRIPEIPGIHGKNVLGIMESYLEPEKLGERIIMLGGGLTACEVGLHLNNCGKQVTIIGRRDSICYHESFKVMPTAIFSPIDTFLEWFQQRGIQLYLNSDVTQVLENGVKIRDTRTGSEQIIQGDTVILAAGMQDQRDLAETFNDVGAGYFAIVGDCAKPKKIREAVSTAFWAAMEV